MAWVYDIKTGEFSNNGGVFCHTERNSLPVGTYQIGYVRTEPEMGEAGMFVYRFDPLIGGTNVGVIIDVECGIQSLVLPLDVRLRVAVSEDRVLEVVQD
jgi:hypothetical protein